MVDVKNGSTEGWHMPGLEAVAEAFTRNFVKGGELGAQVAVYIGGREALVLWGGDADRAGTDPWRRDTLVSPASAGKGLFSFCIHRLVEQGRLGYDDLVADHWPAFAGAGKAAIRVRHLLGQSSGLQATFPVIVYKTPIAELLEVIEAASPATPPGEQGAYHSQTLSALLASLLYSVTGEEIANFFRREIAGPWGIDAFLSLPGSEYHRTAETIIAAGSYYHRLQTKVRGVPATDQDLVTRPTTAHLTTYANARAFARIYGGAANGGVLDGVKLFSNATVAAMAEPQWTNSTWYPFDVPADDHKRRPMTGSLGFFKAGGAFNLGPNQTNWGMPGAGGSVGFADPERALGFGYVLNGWWSEDGENPRCKALIDALYQSL